ncbi:MFS MFS-1 protein [Rhizoctonia solani AG-3 Rhs1AP]|uniref:MFS MFS-1 protein n=1 Tax=Rhizoctonia solani AG-3 Rhs1AP TaxID=1086054 RepID=X8JEF1_9AGAM|nr:MFS MFS-1 protein [Rhizoctonia solani AG-3 Rhs1AP]
MSLANEPIDDPQSPLAPGKRPPPVRVSFSRQVRPTRSRLTNADLAAPTSGPGGGGGVPLGERVYSIPESTVRMSMAVPTGLPSPNATPLPVIPLIVLGIILMGEFLSANVFTPWAFFLVESFETFEPGDIGLWTGILVSVFFIAQFLTSILWSSLAERFGRRVVLVTSLIGSGLTCIAFGMSKSFGFAIAIRLLQGAFGGAVGVARGSVASISDSTNEAQAYAILGFCWGMGGVAGAIIGGVFESPAKKWNLFAHLPVFVEFPYLLPTLVAASITISGGLLALMLDRDGGPRARPGASNIHAAETGASLIEHSPVRCLDESRALRGNSALETPLVENYGAMSNVDQGDVNRLGVPFGERTWTLSSAISGNSGYGEPYSSRFGNGFRHRFSTASLVATARRRAGIDEDLEDMYAGNEPEGQEPRLAERMVMANELTVTSIGDLWVASALTMDVEDDDLGEFDDQSAPDGDSSAITSNTVRAAPITEHRARSVSATRRVALSVEGNTLARDNRPYSLSANNSISRLQLNSYPTIFQNTGLRSPSPGFDTLDASGATGGNLTNVDVLQPIIEGKPVGYESQGSESTIPSLFSQLPLVIIFQYGLLALHSTVHDQVFMSYIVSKSTQGGLELDAGDFARLIAMMCLAQIFYQFYLYPPPLGRFSHLSMFRIGTLCLMFSYVSVILVRPFAKSGVSEEVTMADLSISAIRYCGITFSYTAVTVLLNYMCTPQTVGLANGLAQSVVSLARFMGPVSNGTIYKNHMAHCMLVYADFGWLRKLLIEALYATKEFVYTALVF